ncbi:hypothetical protein [Rhodococcus chondri]|uniref:Uncharacterized protein n=1 Tax=Rhodococcus chondri TaxID=3065941 RepID=A0ABU7JLL9_9NOCA|nr:hypothetical protein [Rhodococcus sp. CC-R104]MEE2030934.1 hypothetical protein [Rhodococcus sp. CC-R104]
MAHDRLLFIGHPDAEEIAHWSTLRELAPQRGWVPTRKFEPGEVVWAVAAGSVLRSGPSSQSRIVDALRDADIPCTSALDAIKHAYTAVRLAG